MNKQEQIEEMAGAVISAAIRANAIIDRSVAIHLKEFINNLYNAGYRKAEEVRKETAKVILEIMSNIICEMYGEDANGPFANCWKMFLKAKIKEYGVEVEE